VNGEIDVALDRADRARTLAEECGDRFAGAQSVRILAEIHSRPDRLQTDIAERYYREALALAEPRGMCARVAHCHLGLGKLYRRTGTREQAQEHLTTATTMYREVDMRFWLEKAEAEMTARG
jgi:predicted N-acetyltransferase YhbS